MEITKPEGNLPNAGSLEVASGAGPEIMPTSNAPISGTAGDQIGRGGETLHVPADYTTVDSRLPDSCTGPVEKADVELSRMG